jgi:hypothetical protein
MKEILFLLEQLEDMDKLKITNNKATTKINMKGPKLLGTQCGILARLPTDEVISKYCSVFSSLT